ncbi:Hypothetical_protein [Hexamita inflata]|uniref:Hypothetical_protein n=1 Tax=Hexamita inflata TaxID=28002 RepID=A0AA86R6H9_9EUKA|nr:Hypothetical protein HINF_LOCUS59105 [Hexamita inflata]
MKQTQAILLQNQLKHVRPNITVYDINELYQSILDSPTLNTVLKACMLSEGLILYKLDLQSIPLSQYSSVTVFQFLQQILQYGIQIRQIDVIINELIAQMRDCTNILELSSFFITIANSSTQTPFSIDVETLQHIIDKTFTNYSKFITRSKSKLNQEAYVEFYEQRMDEYAYCFDNIAFMTMNLIRAQFPVQISLMSIILDNIVNLPEMSDEFYAYVQTAILYQNQFSFSLFKCLVVLIHNNLLQYKMKKWLWTYYENIIEDEDEIQRFDDVIGDIPMGASQVFDEFINEVCSAHKQ